MPVNAASPAISVAGQRSSMPSSATGLVSHSICGVSSRCACVTSSWTAPSTIRSKFQNRARLPPGASTAAA